MRNNNKLFAFSLFLFFISGIVLGSAAEGIFLNGARGKVSVADGRTSFSLDAQGREKKPFDAHALFPVGIEIRKGKLYQVRFKAHASQEMKITAAIIYRMVLLFFGNNRYHPGIGEI